MSYLINRILFLIFAVSIIAPITLPGETAIEESFTFEDTESQADPLQFHLSIYEDRSKEDNTLTLALQVTPEEGWHAYWKNPGKVGMPLQIEWNLPNGYELIREEWPAPEKHLAETGTNYLFHRPFVIFATIRSPSAEAAKKDISAAMRWVACSDSTCLPGTSDASLDVEPLTPEMRTDLENAHEKLPKSAKASQARVANGLLEIEVEAKGNYTSAWFAPESNDFDISAEDTIVKPSTENPKNFRAVLRLNNPPSRENALKGVLILSDGTTQEAIAVDTSLNAATSDIGYLEDLEIQPIVSDTAEYNSEFDGGVALALVFAFIGGLLLNLMPCVLPVISFKILGFIQVAGKNKKVVMQHGLAFAFGVLISFWVVAGLLLGLQAYGHAVGWGFQLQEPIFIAVLAALIMAFGLSLFGVFEIGLTATALAGKAQSTGQQSHGLIPSFLNGVLATAVATPCTGPFLGTAIGFAVTLPPFWALMIFTSLGVGMASPYLLLSFFPGLLRFLPKPGPWMETFKQLMGFLMLATVLWLLWVFGAQTSHMALMVLLAALLVLSIACWVYGRWCTPVRKKGARTFGKVITATLVVLSSYLIFQAVKLQAEIPVSVQTASLPSDQEIADAWISYSSSKVEELRKEGRPILIDFTAKWCLICQTNHLVLSLPDVDDKLKELGVVKMLADWTKRDPEITQALKNFGRNGVPLYVLYSKDPSKPPKVLPQVLTPEAVISALNEMAQ